MIEPGHETLSLRRLGAFLGINRNRLTPCACIRRGRRERKIRRRCGSWTGCTRGGRFTGSAGLVWWINRKRLRRLVAEAGIAAVAPKRWTSQPQTSHAKYPYLLRDLKVEATDQVWCADITYTPM
jgi:hypothetical protein